MKKGVIISSEAPEGVIEALIREGFTIFRLPPCPELSPPVCSHPDMLVLPLGDFLFTYESYYNKYPEVTESAAAFAGLKVATVKKPPESIYPGDIALNALVLSEYIFGLAGHIAEELLLYTQERGLVFTPVKQGYARCSCALLSSPAVITADPSLYRAAQEKGIEALLISKGGIKLPGYDCGFIGGASGLFGNCLYFAGDIKKHPDYSKMHRFALEHKTVPVSLSDKELIDIGGMIFI